MMWIRLDNTLQLVQLINMITCFSLEIGDDITHVSCANQTPTHANGFWIQAHPLSKQPGNRKTFYGLATVTIAWTMTVTLGPQPGRPSALRGGPARQRRLLPSLCTH